MTFRKLALLAPLAATVALAVPVAGASAATTPAPLPNPAGIPCYPYPALCGPDGTPFFQIPSYWPFAPQSSQTPAPFPFQFPIVPFGT
jgi:hypothetical protein